MRRDQGGEMGRHLGYLPGEIKPGGTNNHRNSTIVKTILTIDDPLHIDVPREGADEFDQKFLGKYKWHLTGFDNKIIAM